MPVRLIAVIFASAICAVTTTRARADTMVACSYQAGPRALAGYINSDGRCVPRPESHSREGNLQATAQCRDGFYSYSQHRSGTCSGHGGVAQWSPQPIKSVPEAESVKGTVWRCRRAGGTIQYSNDKCEGGTKLFTYEATRATP